MKSRKNITKIFLIGLGLLTLGNSVEAATKRDFKTQWRNFKKGAVKKGEKLLGYFLDKGMEVGAQSLSTAVGLGLQAATIQMMGGAVDWNDIKNQFSQETQKAILEAKVDVLVDSARKAAELNGQNFDEEAFREQLKKFRKQARQSR